MTGKIDSEAYLSQQQNKAKLEISVQEMKIMSEVKLKAVRKH